MDLDPLQRGQVLLEVIWKRYARSLKRMFSPLSTGGLARSRICICMAMLWLCAPLVLDDAVDFC